MAIFSLLKYNQSNRIDVRIGDGTVKITTILTVRGMLTSKKKYSGGARNKSGGGIKIGGAMLPMPPRWRRAWFQVKSRIQKQAKMFRHVRRACWNKYVNELEQKLSQRTLRLVLVPSSKEDIDVLANKVHSVITKSYEAACPM